MENKRYKAVFGKGEYDYYYFYENELNDYEKENERVSERTLCKTVFTDMIMCNNIMNVVNYDKLETLVSAYNEEEDYYDDEYQLFLVDFDSFLNEEQLIDIVKSMGNTLYYSEELDNYIMGFTDLGTRRDYVLTDLKLELESE